jgi:hypothetical protein
MQASMKWDSHPGWIAICRAQFAQLHRQVDWAIRSTGFSRLFRWRGLCRLQR